MDCDLSLVAPCMSTLYTSKPWESLSALSLGAWGSKSCTSMAPLFAGDSMSNSMTRDCSLSCTCALRIGLSVRVSCRAVRSSADSATPTEVSFAVETEFSTSSRRAYFLAVGFSLAAIPRLTPFSASFIRVPFSSACDYSVCNSPLHSAGSFSCSALLVSFRLLVSYADQRCGSVSTCHIRKESFHSASSMSILAFVEIIISISSFRIVGCSAFFLEILGA
jgi:hypothetical protein